MRYPSRPTKDLYELPPEALLTPDEAADLLRMTATALRQRRCRGEPPAFLKNGFVIRYRKGEVDAFMLGDDDTTPPGYGAVQLDQATANG